MYSYAALVDHRRLQTDLGALLAHAMFWSDRVPSKGIERTVMGETPSRGDANRGESARSARTVDRTAVLRCLSGVGRGWSEDFLFPLE